MEKTVDPFDVVLGGRLRAQRLLNGISQKKLATQIGVSFQQLQKYESGDNRMTAAKVYLAATVLKVTTGHLMGEPAGLGDDPLDAAVGVPGTSVLFDAWRRIDNDRDRRILIKLARELAAPVNV